MINYLQLNLFIFLFFNNNTKMSTDPSQSISDDSSKASPMSESNSNLLAGSKNLGESFSLPQQSVESTIFIFVNL